MVVFVEWMIRKIIVEEELVDVDRFFVVIFINVLAVEMKYWIVEVLEKEFVKNLGFLYIRWQLFLLNWVSILMFYFFCLQVFKKYYYMIDFDLGFWMVDQMEGELFGDEVFDELFEDEYVKGNQVFFEFVDRYMMDRYDLDF